MPAKLYEVTVGAERVKRVRRIMGRSLKRSIDGMGDDLAGFAMVVWDMRGGATTTYLAHDGMVGRSLMPAYVHDALQRHVTCDVIEDCTADIISGA